MSEMPGLDIPALAQMSGMLHEMYISMVAAGFSKDEALTVVSKFLTGMILASQQQSDE